jgi:hypothetical protein
MKTSAKILLITLGAALILIVAVVFWVKNQIDKHTVKASGNVITQIYTPDQFDMIHVSGGFIVNMKIGDKNEVKVTVDENFQKLINVEVKNGILNIESKNVFQSFGAKIQMTCISVSELKLTGGVRFECEDMIDVPDFSVLSTAGTSVKLNGSFDRFKGTLAAGSEMNMTGSAKRADINLAAGSVFDSEQFSTDSCFISAAAGSTADILVNQYLEAEATAGCRIVYEGSPFVAKQNTSSGAMIKKK